MAQALCSERRNVQPAGGVTVAEMLLRTVTRAMSASLASVPDGLGIDSEEMDRPLWRELPRNATPEDGATSARRRATTCATLVSANVELPLNGPWRPAPARGMKAALKTRPWDEDTRQVS